MQTDTSYDPTSGFPLCSSCGQAYYSIPEDEGICGQCWIDGNGGTFGSVYEAEDDWFNEGGQGFDIGGMLVTGDREE